jgi:hypothetical protein
MTGRHRGQTTLDFAIGTGIFLLAVLFVVTYAPTMFDPFAGGTGTKLIVADRAATTLSGDVLAASTADPGILALGCVAELFDESVDGATCSSTDDFDDLDDLLSLDGRHAEVTIHELRKPISTPASPGWADGELQRETDGSTPTDVAVATRTVSIDGQQYRLTVRVW